MKVGIHEQEVYVMVNNKIMVNSVVGLGFGNALHVSVTLASAPILLVNLSNKYMQVKTYTCHSYKNISLPLVII